jgi:hypothetical protein
VSETLFPARDQALTLLDELCQDSLEVPLSHVDSMTERDLRNNNISAKFKWLRDLIVAGIKT